jgi:hypothetical protein
LDLDLEPEQWAGIAMSGVLFDAQSKWLQRKVSDDAIDFLIANCNKDDARTWNEVLRAVPDPPPDRLVDALARRVRTFEADYELTQIARRLTEGNHWRHSGP